MATFCATIASIGGAKLLARAQGGKFSPRSVPQAVLLLRIATNLFRLCYFAIDPLFLNRYLSVPAAQILLTISYPFDVLATLVIAVYWHVRGAFFVLQCGALTRTHP